MNNISVLVLHGSPGSGKTTLARAISEELRAAEVAHAVIDLDELNIVYPHAGRSFARDNLQAIWPNFAALGSLKVILPTVVADADELVALRAAAPASTFVVCELTAPVDILKARVTAREPNEFWENHVHGFVDLYRRRSDLATIRDFHVTTHDVSIAETAHAVLERAGWNDIEARRTST